MVDIFALTRKILKSLEYETQDEVKYSLDQFPSRASLFCHHGCTSGKNNFGSKTALFFLETLKETNLSPEPLKAFYHHSPESVLTQHHSLVSNCTEAERERENSPRESLKYARKLSDSCCPPLVPFVPRAAETLEDTVQCVPLSSSALWCHLEGAAAPSEPQSPG